LDDYKIRSYELKEVGFRYPTGDIVLGDVSLDFSSSPIWHVCGPSGHGQSTLLRIMAFLVEPTAGSILVNGQNATEMSFEEFLPWRLEIGYTFDMGGLLANRSLMENLALPHMYHNLSVYEDVHDAIRAVAKRFRFEHLLDRRPALVSGGLRKLATILRSVLLQPSFLVMDDPFGGLDMETARELSRFIGELQKNSDIDTICLTSRLPDWPAQMGARPLWVEDGCVKERAA
jgi:ABC-type lipoprotein export system ATPase subunit